MRKLDPGNPIGNMTIGELKELIREAVREELISLQKEDEMDIILDSPEILADLEELRRQKEDGKLVLLSRKEAFGDRR